MKCRVCNSEEHFAAECRMGRAKEEDIITAKVVANHLSLAFDSGNADAAASRAHPGPEASEVAPPWGDDIFEPPGASYMAIEEPGETERSNHSSPRAHPDPMERMGISGPRSMPENNGHHNLPPLGPAARAAAAGPLWSQWQGLFGSASSVGVAVATCPIGRAAAAGSVDLTAGTT